MSVPTKIERAPAAFAEQSAKINEIIDAIAPIINAIGAGSVKITKSGENWIISSYGGRNDGIPEMPSGSAGDMLYHDGTSWVVLEAPTGMTTDPVMRFGISSSAPYWEEPEGC